MTAITNTNVTSGLWNRVSAVVKLQFVNPVTVLWMPWAILLTIFLANVAVWALIMAGLQEGVDRAKVAEGFQWSGASTFIFVYMMVVAVQSINATFPFAQGLSVTRRDYVIGASLSFVGLAVIFATGLAILAAIEEATGGWGLGGRMFTAIYFGDGTWYERYFIFFALLLFFFFVGSAIAAVHVRWKAIGVTLFFVALGFALIGVAAILTFANGWEAFGGWLVGNGWVGNYAWSLVITAVAAVATYLVLRKATPRS